MLVDGGNNWRKEEKGKRYFEMGGREEWQKGEEEDRSKMVDDDSLMRKEREGPSV